MIDDLDKKVSSNSAMRGRVATYMMERINTYFSSDCFRTLKNRMKRLDDAVDMRVHKPRESNRAANAFKSKMVVPLVREAFLARRAVTLASARQDPLVTVEPVEGTPANNAMNIQNLLAQNFKVTKFRQKALREVVNYCARYGSGIVIPKWKRWTERKRKTVATGMGYESAYIQRAHNNVVNTTINPLNYFQDPNVPDPDDSSFRGYIERMQLSAYIADYKNNPDLYIKEEIEKVIKEAKKGATADRNYSGSKDLNDWAQVGIDVNIWYGRVNITGNEDDDVTYYAELIGDHLVRFHLNLHDEDLVPIINFWYDKRLNYWWGNVDSENVLPHENFMNLMMNMTADMGLKHLQQYVFYNNSAIDVDPADLQRMARSGGPIPFTPKQPGQSARDIFHSFQFPSMSLGEVQYIMQESKESAQRVRPKADFMRSGLPGGISNQTATAAIQMDEQGDVLESDLLEYFFFGMENMAGANVLLFQPNMPNQFMLRPDPRYQGYEVPKRDILGSYAYRYHSSLTKSKQTQANNLMNFLTFMQNMRGTGDPSWLNVNMPAYIKGMLRKMDLGVNIDEGYPEQSPVQQGAAPQMAVAGSGTNPISELQPAAAGAADMGMM